MKPIKQPVKPIKAWAIVEAGRFKVCDVYADRSSAVAEKAYRQWNQAYKGRVVRVKIQESKP